MNYELLTNNLTKIELIKKIEYLTKIHGEQFNEILHLKLDIKDLRQFYIESLKDFNEYPIQMLKFYHNKKLLNLEIYLN